MPSGLARLTQKIVSALLSESYRKDPGAWEPEEEGELPVAEKMEAYAAGQETYRPYFEVLIGHLRPAGQLGAGAPGGAANPATRRSVHLRNGPGGQL